MAVVRGACANRLLDSRPLPTLNEAMAARDRGGGSAVLLAETADRSIRDAPAAASPLIAAATGGTMPSAALRRRARAAIDGCRCMRRGASALLSWSNSAVSLWRSARQASTFS